MSNQLIAERAHAAGIAAMEAACPEPMIVKSVETVFYVPEGACGFAWIKLRGDNAFGRWAKKVGLARPAYPRGLSIWVSVGGQSVDRKSAYAFAYAESLRADGVVGAYADSRLD